MCNKDIQDTSVKINQDDTPCKFHLKNPDLKYFENILNLEKIKMGNN